MKGWSTTSGSLLLHVSQRGFESPTGREFLRREDLHSASSTKDCSRDAVPEEGGGCLSRSAEQSGRAIFGHEIRRAQGFLGSKGISHVSVGDVTLSGLGTVAKEGAPFDLHVLPCEPWGHVGEGLESASGLGKQHIKGPFPFVLPVRNLSLVLILQKTSMSANASVGPAFAPMSVSTGASISQNQVITAASWTREDDALLHGRRNQPSEPICDSLSSGCSRSCSNA